MRSQHILPLAALFVISIWPCCQKKPLRNPCDPRNPNYVEPFCTIVSGPENGETLSQSEALITWEGVNTECGLVYYYKLAYESVFDQAPWSDSTSETSVFLQDLDEESYTFGVKAAYRTPDEQEVPATRNFTVDAYREPSLLIKPCVTTAFLNDQFTVEVTVEEVENLMATKINMNFSRDTLEIVQDGIGEGEFLTRNGGQVLLFDSVLNSQGKVEIDLGTAGGTPPGVSGSGTLAVITFRAKNKGAASISFETHDLRDTVNQAIEIKASRGGKVSIE